MSELRNAMNDQMLLKGFSERTKKSYLNAVSLLARHYHSSPDKLNHQDIQDWFLYLIKERKLSTSTCRLYLNAIRFFYLNVLHWQTLECEFNTPKQKQKIPDLLSVKEVGEIIEKTQNKKYRTMFTLCYACGLRVSELVAIKLAHIHGDEHYLQIVQGKGAKDRNIPLPHTALLVLRRYWQAYHPKIYLFPGKKVKQHIHINSVQKQFKNAKSLATCDKVGGIHSLRHAFASHQLSAGMPIHQLKTILGHTDLKSTERYLHWCPRTSTQVGHFDLLIALIGGQTDA